MLRVKNLSKIYKDGTEALKGVSFTAKSGEFIVILGKSGSGKSTLLKCINRLVEPSTGSVWIDGRNVAELAPHELRRRIGYTFQQVGLFPHMTVGENVAVTPTLLGWPSSKVERWVDELLELVELDPQDIRDRHPAQLSGGQQQRVGVARALAAKPRIMLLDEPFGALDPLTRQRLQESFIRIKQELCLTVVFVTHDMVEALVLGDRIAVMKEGDLIQAGTPAALMREPTDDYVRQLLDTPRREARLVESLLAADSGSPKNTETGDPTGQPGGQTEYSV